MKKCMGCMIEYIDDVTVCPACGYSQAAMQKEMQQFSERLPIETILGGRYILGRLLSITDYSMIYSAWDALLQTRVAVREYFPSDFSYRAENKTDIEFYDDDSKTSFEKGRKAFEEEAQRIFLIQAVAESVNYYRIIQENHTSYIVMEYLEGITLADYMETRDVCTEDEATDLMNRIIKVMDVMYQKNILHLNLSPDHIYLNDKNEIHLIDYGCAKAEYFKIADCEPEIYLEDYISPEVLEGKDAGRSSDLYSLGCIGYYLLSGNAPTRKNLSRLKGVADKKSALSQRIQLLTSKQPELREKGLVE